MALIIEDNDPCAAAASLRTAYANLVAGQAVQEVRFRAGPNGVERMASYQRADPGRLLTVVREYEAKCAAASGGKPRRFAMRAGGTY